FAAKLREQIAGIASLRDLQYGQALDYPTLNVLVDREQAGLGGAAAADRANAAAAAAPPPRLTRANFLADSPARVGYQVQVEVPARKMNSVEALGTLPVKGSGGRGLESGGNGGEQLLVRDVARLEVGSMPGEVDRYNMRRQVSLTANISGEDLGRVA